MSAEPKITGGCLCGAIRWEADQAPFRAGICHCRECQRSLGNLFGPSLMFKHDAFQFVKGEPKWYQGSLANRGFCSDCGSPIAFQYRGAKHITIWVGSLDRTDDFQPQAHWGVESKVPWVDILPDLPAYITEEYSSYLDALSSTEK
jgi:hypothetical protein